MSQVYDNAVPIVNLSQGLLYVNGAIVSTVPAHTSQLSLSAGIMRDSSNTYDLNIGNFNGQVNESAAANVATVINCAVNGLNGLDTGSLAASSVYYVYVVADPVSGLPSGAMASLAAPSVGPLIPYGYSVYRHVGYAVTSGGSVFLAGYTAGNNNTRLYMYDAPISVGSTSSQASYTGIALTNFVPPVNNLPVYLNASIIGGSAGDTLSLQPGNATGDAIVIVAAATTYAFKEQVMVLSQLVSSVPTINYKNSGTDTIAILVGGFEYFI